MLALPVYYPFDLLKTRMQTTEVKGKYNNLFDAFIKTYAENLSSSESTQVKSSGLVAQAKDKLMRLRRFYTAMHFYGGTYVTFIAIEFSLYESVLRQIEI